MASNAFREMVARALAQPDEHEAFAQLLYLVSGGFVDWKLLAEESRTKKEYRENARYLLNHYRERNGKVAAPLQLTPEMIEAGYRAMLAARPGPASEDEPPSGPLALVAPQEDADPSTSSGEVIG
jgi:hypothetical protein